MRQGPFVVNVVKLRRDPASVLEVRREGPLAGLAVTGSRVPEGGSVAVEATLEMVHGGPHAGVMVHGTVTAPWAGECRRCLKPASGEVSAEVRELFGEDSDPEDAYPLRGDQLDLEPLARDAVLLELPLAPLCDEECQGLCPTCGADRNEGACGCPEQDRDPRWAALDALRQE